MAHPLAAHLGAGDLDAAAFADDALEPDSLVLAAVALPVLGGTEDLLAEEPVLLRLERAVVDGLRLLDLAVGPRPDRVGRGEGDPELVEVVDVEQLACLPLCDVENGVTGLARPGGPAGRGQIVESESGDALGGAPGVLFVGTPFRPGQVDAELFGGAEDVLVELAHLDLLARGREDLDVEAEALHLLDQHLERLGDAGLGDVLALDDGLVDLHPAQHVVGLDGEQLLQGVGRAVGLEGPHLHLPEPLAAELGLAAQGLLRDHRVGAGGPGVDLVVDQVEELEDVAVADGDGPVVGLAGAAVVEDLLAVGLDEALAVAAHRVGVDRLQQAADGGVLAGAGRPLFVPVGPVEDGRRHPHRRVGDGPGLGCGGRVRRLGIDPVAVPAPAGGVAQVGLQNLAHVHPAGHAQGVEDDVDRGAVGQMGHVLHREDLGDDALVAVAAGQLVALGDLALLGDVDPDQLVHAGSQLVLLLPGEHLDVDDLARLAVGHLEAGVADLSGLLAEDGPQEALLGGELGLALGGDLAHQHVARAHLGPDADDAPLVEVLQDLLGQVGDVTGDLLRPQLGVAGVDLVGLDVDRREDVVAHQALGEDDGVLEVVALPRHEGDEQVLAQGQVAVVGGRAVGQHVALLDRHAHVDQGLLVDAGALVGAAELGQPVELAAQGAALAVGLAVGVLHPDVVAGDLLDLAVALGQHHVARVAGGPQLDARADVGRLGPHQGDGLALHVGPHEGPVGVVVLEERDHGRGHGHDLLGRDVHQVDLGRGHVVDLAGGAVGRATCADAHTSALRAPSDEHPVADEGAVVVERGVGLGDDVLFLLIGREVHDLVGDVAVDDLAVGRLDEAEVVDPGVGGEGADQADVGAFRGLDGAHPAVVAGVHVTHLETGPLPGQSAGAQRREAALVGEAVEGVGLAHELGELAGTEELLDGRHHRTDVDERLGRDRLHVLGGHPLPDDPLHAGQADSHLVLDQLAHRSDAAVGEVVLVVEAVARLARSQVQQVGGGGEDLGGAQHELGLAGTDQVDVEQARDLLDLGAELAAQLVAADPGEVVALGVEEGVLEVRPAGLDRGRLAGAGPFVDLDQRLLAGGGEPRSFSHWPSRKSKWLTKLLEEPGGGLLVVAQGAEEHEQAQATLAGHPGAGGDVLARLLLDVELDPLTAVGVDGGGGDRLGVAAGLEDDARRADELGHNDPLGAVDDERALVGHHREVPHEDRLLLDLAGARVHEAGPHEDGGGVGHVLLLALLHRELRRRAQVGIVGIELELEPELSGEVLDRADVAERLL